MKHIKLLFVLFTIFHINQLLAQNCNNQSNQGDGTYYASIAGTDSGHCSIPIPGNDFMYCAMNKIDYDQSEACGACIEATGPKGKVIVKVVDECPECAKGDVDFSQQAFSKIANVIDGRVTISWKYVPCPLGNTKIKIRHKEGSHRYWTAIQLLDIKHAVTKLEYKKSNGTWQAMNRAVYNYFIEPNGIAAPMTLRATSILGERIQFTNVPFSLTSLHNTNKQFATPAGCNQTASTMVYSLKKKNFNFFMDTGWGAENQQPIGLYEKRNNNNQKFEEIDQGGGFYSYKKKGTNFAIDGGNGGAKGNPVYLYTYNPNNFNQHWKKINTGDGHYVLQKRNASSFAIDGGNGGENNQKLKLWNINLNNSNQKWRFDAVGSSKVAATEYEKVGGNVTLYPNPVTNVLHISNLPEQSTAIHIYNINGVLLKEVKPETNTNTLQIDVDFLAKGFYFLEIISKNQKLSQKFMK